jgi:hypothetical protein
MIATPKEQLTTWYQMWTQDLEKNLADQAALKEDEQRLRDLVATCEQAFALLFPPDPEPTPTGETQ